MIGVGCWVWRVVSLGFIVVRHCVFRVFGDFVVVKCVVVCVLLGGVVVWRGFVFG